MMAFLVFFLPLMLGLCASLLAASYLRSAWVLVWLAPGIGIGLSSVLFFAWSLVFFPRFQPGLYLTVEVLITLLLAVLAWRRRACLDLRLPRLRLAWTDGLLAAALAGAAFFFAYRFLAQTLENPFGGWDAWAFWNARARFFLAGGAASWRSVFSEHVTHADYPYLLTGFIARGWVLLGDDRTFVPVVTAGLFSLATVGLLMAAVGHLHGLRSALLAGFLLLSLPVFAWTSASQYADLPLAFYLLASGVLVSLFFTQDEQPGFLYLAGLLASFALWTKNEGASFVLSLALSLALSALLGKSNRLGRPQGWRSFLAGIFPVLLLYAAFKGFLAPPTDIFADRPLAALLAQLAELSRYRMIAAEVGRLFWEWGGWRVPYLPALAVAVLLIGWDAAEPQRKAAQLALLTMLGLTYLQYLLIFVITPHDLSWHLSTAAGRLYVQLLPGLLLALFLWLRPLQDAPPRQR